MALGDPYATLDDLKTYLSMQEDSRFDTSLTQALESVSEEIEQYCNRQFNKVVASSAREFPIMVSGHVIVDDFYDATGLVVETSIDGGVTYTAVPASGYKLYPLNGIVDGQPGWPYNKIKPRGLGAAFPRGGLMRITPTGWGWNAVPAPVKQSCLILGGATFQIKDAPFGVAGSDQWGSIRVKDNPMAQTKLNRYVVDRILVG